MDRSLYGYMLVMAGVTYLIRVLPLTLIRKEIKNPFIRSFLNYVPYVTLSAMTFPAILTATGNVYSGLAALLIALFLAVRGKGLITVAIGACAVVFIVELITKGFL
ncbi:MAG: AzlD domain-containing protein [Lachnospiraceae bacterium]|nr:AzlD domain-containing protein [Lachnospiraceae bacterium]